MVFISRLMLKERMRPGIVTVVLGSAAENGMGVIAVSTEEVKIGCDPAGWQAVSRVNVSAIIK
jgi:hypothetical protein